MKRILALVAIAIATFSNAVQADRIVLIYGDILEGEVVGETDTTITFRGEFGERTLMRSDIREIQTEGGESVSPAPAPAPAQNVAPSAPAPAPTPQAQTATPPMQANPNPYDILKRNVEMQSQWKDLEIAYLQRSYINGQTIETQYIARIIPPDYLRANLTTPIPSTPQMPEGGKVEYDMYRSKNKLFQVVKMPNQDVQYLKLDLARIDGVSPGDNPVEAFKKGFAGAGSNENLVQAIARNSAIIGIENTDGHDCWVLETVNTPDLVEAQLSSQPADLRERLRQELSQLGRIRSWVGKDDLIQWRMENYSREGDLLLSMKMVTVKPDQNLTPEQLRMKVPKGTASAFVDVTDMVAGQFNEVINGSPGMVPIPSVEDLQRGPAQPYQSTNPNEVWPGQSRVTPQPQSAPGSGPQTIPQTYTSAQPAAPPQGQVAYSQQPQMVQQIPQQQMMMQPTQQQPMVYQQPVAYQQPAPQQYQAYPPQAPYGQPYTQTYVIGGPQGMAPQQQMQAMPQQQMQMQMAPQQQQRSSGGGFLQKLFGGGGKSQNNAIPMGVSPSGNQTMMVPVVNGQPQLPTQ
ncbi:MAG: hypothetical protein KC917_01275 [Candidatus Omnitrophica bacterium]|nr:hypothetical protein [Candidatus Omnitrophota bacterium]